jgi:predicted nuclease with RNAse H fold
LTRVGGIDLAAEPKNTAACVIEGDRIASLVTAVRGEQHAVADDALVEIVAGCEKVGIDAPFGWPRPFVEAVVTHREGGPWPGRGEDDAAAFRRRLRLRATDEAVCALEDVGVTPLSVSTDRIGVAAFRCALLLDRIGDVDRTGRSGPVCEVYPAAALRRWYRDEAKGYKRDVQVRRKLVEQVAEDTGTDLGSFKATMVASDHAFDAFVCALVAIAVQRGETGAPDDEELAAEEGWIHVPAGDTPPQLSPS